MAAHLPKGIRRRKVVEIDEATRSTWIVPQGTEVVSFRNRSSTVTADLNELRRALESQPGRSDVGSVSLGYRSQCSTSLVVELFASIQVFRVFLRGVKDIAPLEQLKYLTLIVLPKTHPKLDVIPKLQLTGIVIDIRDFSDAGFIGGCQTLQKLMVRQWRHEDMVPLSALKLRRLRLVAGNVRNFKGLDCSSLDNVMLQICAKLESVSDLSVRELDISSCKRLDLNTLAPVHGLKVLALRSMQQLESLDFIRDCKQLEKLIIAAPKHRRLDFSPLIGHESLRCVFLGITDTKKLEEIAKANPRLAVTNGLAWCDQGRESDRNEFGHIYKAAGAAPGAMNPTQLTET